MRIRKDQIKEVPFQNRQVLLIQVGAVLTDDGVELFRYTRPIERVRNAFRITLQYFSDPEHIPYVFDVRREPSGTLSIVADSQDAIEVWKENPDDASSRKEEILAAVETIFHMDIESDVDNVS